MEIHLPALSGLVFTYLLVFSRVGAMVMLLPAIGEMGVPSRVRLVLALASSFALTPQVQANYPATAEPASFLQLALLVHLGYACAAAAFPKPCGQLPVLVGERAQPAGGRAHYSRCDAAHDSI